MQSACGMKGEPCGRCWAGLERAPRIPLRVGRKGFRRAAGRGAIKRKDGRAGPMSLKTCGRLLVPRPAPSTPRGWICPLGSLGPFRLLQTRSTSSSLPKNRCPFRGEGQVHHQHCFSQPWRAVGPQGGGVATYGLAKQLLPGAHPGTGAAGQAGRPGRRQTPSPVGVAQLKPFRCSKSSTVTCGLRIPLSWTELEGPVAVALLLPLAPTCRELVRGPGQKPQSPTASPPAAHGGVGSMGPVLPPACLSPACLPPVLIPSFCLVQRVTGRDMSPHSWVS